MRFVGAIMKGMAAGVLLLVGLAALVALFELPPWLIRVTIGPMHPELAQVYTMFEIGIILCILIFGLPAGYARFSRFWDGRLGRPKGEGQ